MPKKVVRPTLETQILQLDKERDALQTDTQTDTQTDRWSPVLPEPEVLYTPSTSSTIPCIQQVLTNCLLWS